MATSDTARSNTSDSLTRTIVEEVADLEGVEATELEPPLYDIINPDALTDLFRDRDGCRVEFRYCGYDVVVRGDRDVRIAEPRKAGPRGSRE